MDKKISQLDPAAALDGTELLAVVQGGSTLKSAVSTVKTYLDTFYQPLDADLSAIAALGYASTSFLKKTGANTWALDTNTYQVSNANLTSLSALSYVSGAFVKMTSANTFSLDTSTYLTTSDAASTYVPLTRTLTINGTSYDLSANRSWTIAAGVTGSGTINYVSKWASSTSLGDSLIYDNGTNVGIGTATLSALLHIKGTTSDNTAYALKVDNSSSSSLLYVRNDGLVSLNYSSGVANLFIKGTTGNDIFQIYDSSLNYVANVNSSGLWGIGANAISGVRFRVEGETRLTNGSVTVKVDGTSLSVDGGANTNSDNFVIKNNSDGTYFVATSSGGNGRIGIGISNPDASATVHIKGSTSDNTTYALKVDNSSSSALLYVRNDGSVWASGKGANVNNTVFGYNAGVSYTTGVNNTAYGTYALNACTEGNTNTAIGRWAMLSLTTGSQNISVGYNSLGGIVNGSNNIAIGVNTLAAINAGSHNVVIGVNAFSSNIDGNFNTSLGSNTGYSNTSGSSNVFLGYNAGYYETGSNKLFIDNRQRTDEATSRTNSMIYGVFNATPANQEIRLNAGLVLMAHLPTSSAGLPTGAIWNNSGVINIV